MRVLHFGNIDEKNMDYSVDVDLVQRWKDPRLVHSLNEGITYTIKHRLLFWKNTYINL